MENTLNRKEIKRQTIHLVITKNPLTCLYLLTEKELNIQFRDKIRRNVSREVRDLIEDIISWQVGLALKSQIEDKNS